MSSRMHEMVELLRECGEDAECSCGCGPEPKGKKMAKKKELDEGGASRVLLALSESRKKIGIRQMRRLRKVARPRPGRAFKVRHAFKMHSPVRKGPAQNRHR